MKQLRITTSKPYGIFGHGDALVQPDVVGEIIKDKIKGKTAYIHGDAEKIAGFDIPIFIDGNLSQLEY